MQTADVARHGGLRAKVGHDFLVSMSDLDMTDALMSGPAQST